MSPEPNSTKVCETNEGDCKMNNKDFVNTVTATCSENCKQQTSDATKSDGLLKPPAQHPRERRNISPLCVNLQDVFPDPLSPSSSSTTSQATSANDATFEPTIEMMVNDFDDEQTLNEEEAMAAHETQDPDEEISTLKEESEMPLEELLAKYKALPLIPPPSFVEPPRKKSKKSSSKKTHKSKQKNEERNSQLTPKENVEESADKSNIADASSINSKASEEVFASESGDEKELPENDKVDEEHEEVPKLPTLFPSKTSNNLGSDERKGGIGEGSVKHTELVKVRRSHLLDLYPEGTFDNVVVVKDAIAGNGKDIPMQTLYDAEDDEDDEIEEEEDEDFKKKVMIGTSYQATIPNGLSQYGDILPYENEDKLIWEPSQVSEREVEEYLLKIRDIKSNQQGNEDTSASTNEENISKVNGRMRNNANIENNSLMANGEKLQVQINTTAELDNQPVVKDNEQALHLLVQCGYDFKEALRRKRLNALPLNDCMSLWSEEECHKFEEGIQKYGKDFLKIRQNQVRTRTMRELVQFYYLWKKSERRDHNFANADTVDHMDIYLNEDNEYGSNPASAITPVGSPVGTTSTSAGTRRNSNASQKNISIMTTNNNTAALNSSLDKSSSTAATQHQQQQRRRASNNCPSNVITNDFIGSEHSTNILTSSTK